MAKSVNDCVAGTTLGGPHESRRDWVVALALAAADTIPGRRERTRAAEARQRQRQPRSQWYARYGTGRSPGRTPVLCGCLRLDHGQREREITHRIRLKATLASAPNWCKCGFWKARQLGRFSPEWQRLVTAIWGGKFI